MRIIILPYLTFNGSCREAMQFYQKCLGGDLYFQTISDTSHTNKKIRGKIGDYILHSTLTNRTLKLMASDIVNDGELIRGNSISISIECSDKTVMSKYYKRLSKGGRNLNAIKKTKWGTYFGSLTDKFNNHWMFTCNNNQTQK